MSEPRIITTYAVERRLGSTGPTEAFKGRHLTDATARPIVIKRLQPRLGTLPEHVKDFLESARAAACLDHPNIAEQYETDVDGEGLPFTVMEFVDGPTVAQIILRATETGELPLTRLVSLFVGAASALAEAHHTRGADGRPLGLVHGDVSTDNLRVTFDGVTKVLDFGQVRVGAVLKNKVRHTAPELLADATAKPTPASDVFGLGVCLFLATTGAWPFAGITEEQLRRAAKAGRYRRPSELIPGFPAELEQSIIAALSVDPTRRPTARELGEQLATWLSTAGEQMSDLELRKWIRANFADRHHGTPIAQPVPEELFLDEPPRRRAPRAPPSVLTITLEDPFAACSREETSAPVSGISSPFGEPTNGRTPGGGGHDLTSLEVALSVLIGRGVVTTGSGDEDFTSADVLLVDLGGDVLESIAESGPPSANGQLCWFEPVSE